MALLTGADFPCGENEVCGKSAVKSAHVTCCSGRVCGEVHTSADFLAIPRVRTGEMSHVEGCTCVLARVHEGGWSGCLRKSARSSNSASLQDLGVHTSVPTSCRLSLDGVEVCGPFGTRRNVMRPHRSDWSSTSRRWPPITQSRFEDRRRPS